MEQVYVSMCGKSQSNVTRVSSVATPFSHFEVLKMHLCLWIQKKYKGWMETINTTHKINGSKFGAFAYNFFMRRRCKVLQRNLNGMQKSLIPKIIFANYLSGVVVPDTRNGCTWLKCLQTARRLEIHENQQDAATDVKKIVFLKIKIQRGKKRDQESLLLPLSSYLAHIQTQL